MKEGPATFSYTASFQRLSVLASIVMPFAFAIAAFLQKPGSVGQFSTCCLALASLAGWWRLRTITGPILVLTDTGLTDHRWASTELPWLAFTGMHVHPTQGWKTVVLDVDPAQPGLTRWIRMNLRIRAWLAPRLSAWFSPGIVAALGLGERGLWISARGLDVDLETLHATLKSRMQRARPADR